MSQVAAGQQKYCKIQGQTGFREKTPCKTTQEQFSSIIYSQNGRQGSKMRGIPPLLPPVPEGSPWRFRRFNLAFRKTIRGWPRQDAQLPFSSLIYSQNGRQGSKTEGIPPLLPPRGGPRSHTQRAEGGGRRAEGGGRRAECRGRRAEGAGRRAQGAGRRAQTRARPGVSPQALSPRL